MGTKVEKWNYRKEWSKWGREVGSGSGVGMWSWDVEFGKRLVTEAGICNVRGGVVC